MLPSRHERKDGRGHDIAWYGAAQQPIVTVMVERRLRQPRTGTTYAEQRQAACSVAIIRKNLKLRLGLSEFREKKCKFCVRNLQTMLTIFVNSAQILRTFSSQFFHFKIISGISVQSWLSYQYTCLVLISLQFWTVLHFYVFFTFWSCFILLFLHLNGLRWLWQPSVPK